MMAQSVDLFKWSDGNIVAQQQFVTLGQNNSPTFVHNPINPYKTYNISSPNNAHQYSVIIGGSDTNMSSEMYDVFMISDKSGKTLLCRWGNDPLYNIQYLTLNKDDKNHFIQVPLDDNSFALLFAGNVFDGNDDAGEMIVVVVNKDKATVVFDKPACAYSFTPAPNFAIEFTEKTDDILNADGYAIGAKADMKATKHKIWKEGNMLKYKKWN